MGLCLEAEVLWRLGTVVGTVVGYHNAAASQRRLWCRVLACHVFQIMVKTPTLLSHSWGVGLQAYA